jgi:hypothetical protein
VDEIQTEHNFTDIVNIVWFVTEIRVLEELAKFVEN